MDSYQHILYPSDLSPEAEIALPHLALLARSAKTRVTFLHVVEPVVFGPTFGEAYSTNIELLDTLHRNAVRYAEEKGPEILRKHLSPEIPIEISVVQGNPATEIVEFAKREGCDLIVMATHGRSGFKRLILGSVAEKAIRQTTVPILLIPMKS